MIHFMCLIRFLNLNCTAVKSTIQCVAIAAANQKLVLELNIKPTYFFLLPDQPGINQINWQF